MNEFDESAREEGYCGYIGDGRESPCKLVEGWGYDNTSSGFCQNHGNRGGKEGNQNAVGHGAPENNDNAQKHALHARRGKFYKRLGEAKQRHVDELEAALINRYQEFHGREPDAADVRDMFEIAVGYVQRDYAREYLVDQMEESGNLMLEHVEMEKDGEVVEFDKPNSLLESIGDNRREDRLQRRDKGLEKDPESQKASAEEDLAEAWRSALQ